MEPVDPVGIASAGVDLIGGIYNAISANQTNIKNRDFTKEMYGRQRADALSDWHMQNQYNSPEEQMRRFRAAGLNPNLIYNNQTQSPTIKSASASGGEAKAPQFGGNPIAAYQDASLRSVQTNNLKLQQENIQSQNELIQAQIVNTLMNAEGKSLSNDMVRAQWETTLETSLKKLENLQVSAASGWQQLEQRGQLFPVQMAKIIADTASTEMGTKLKAKQIQGIAQSISKSLTDQQLTELKKIDQTKRNAMLDDVHQLIILDKGLKSGKVSLQDQEKQINDIKIKWRGAGLSETTISDLMKSILGIKIR